MGALKNLCFSSDRNNNIDIRKENRTKERAESMKRLNGIRLPMKRRAQEKQITALPLPKLVRIPMLMHMGDACEPTVEPDEYVYVGQEIGRPVSDAAVPVHASVSGTVSVISEYQMPDGATVPCVEIVPDGQQVIHPDCQPPKIEKKQDLIDAARKSGCVGLGGSGDLTFQKLSRAEKISVLILNGAECETCLASDLRMMLENPDQILGGAALLQKVLKIKDVRIGVQSNQPAAIRALADAAKSAKGITVCPLPPVYPQGEKRVLVYHTTGIVVPEDKEPEEIGVLVLNVSTCAFLYQYAQTGIPLVERVVTVDGNAVPKACNLLAPIGTPVIDLLLYASCELDLVKQIWCGGAMMGVSYPTFRASVTKAQNGIIALKNPKKERTVGDCIRCGKCMRACPMNLIPAELDRAYEDRDVRMLTDLHAGICMNCGCCTYVCPANRPLAEHIQRAKTLLSNT